MRQIHNDTWIHLAGNPPNVLSGKPPYWRYRIGPAGKESVLYGWVIRDDIFDKTNNTQGIEIGASFLLWYAVYGSIRVQELGDGRPVARISLKQGVKDVGHSMGVITQEFSWHTMAIHGAPDRVNQKSALWWRCVVDGKEVDLARWQVTGPARPTKFNGPGEDTTNANPLRRLWLNFQGTLQVDENSNGLIELR